MTLESILVNKESPMKPRDLTVGMLIGPTFEDLEFWSVFMRVREAGFKTLVIGTEGGETFISKGGGLTAQSQVAARDVKAADLFALLVPGGFAPDKMRRDPDMLRLVRELDAAKKILGFICHAGWVAASAKILKGRPVTGSQGIKDDLENAGGHWVDQPAFRDGHLVWGRVVDDIPAYQRELVEALEESSLKL
jgi:protease I